MAEKHFLEQKQHTKSYLLPYFEKHVRDFRHASVLEIGCAEGGFLDVLHGLKIKNMGVELSQSRVDTARKQNPNLQIIQGDITDSSLIEKIHQTFDLIVMRDTIEHIADKQKTFKNLSRLLKSGGFLYITYPPKFSGFGGHQQVSRSCIRYLPYFHLLPSVIIRTIGKILREKPHIIDNIISFKRTGLRINQFEEYCYHHGFKPVVRELFLSRPIYKTRFRIKARRLPNIPFLREVSALGCEYLLKKR